MVTAKRYFTTTEEVVEEICQEINDRDLNDFGSFLKGNDMFHEGKISNQCFFQILQKIFGEMLGEGDILDLISYFDTENEGTIKIREIQYTFNKRIDRRENQIKLVSWIDACVEEAIVEPLSPRSKAAKKKEEDDSLPDHYRKQMLVDIHSGAIVKANEDLSAWFN